MVRRVALRNSPPQKSATALSISTLYRMKHKESGNGYWRCVEIGRKEGQGTRNEEVVLCRETRKRYFVDDVASRRHAEVNRLLSGCSKVVDQASDGVGGGGVMRGLRRPGLGVQRAITLFLV